MQRYGLPGRCLAFTALVSSFALADSPGTSAGWIVIPASEYQSLRTRAYPPDRAAVTPAPEKTITRVDYDLRVDGAAASGKAALTVDVLKEGWVQVPIPAGLLVREARLDGKLLALTGGAGPRGQLSALLSSRGRAVLQLDVVVAVPSSGGTEKLVLPATASGITRASVVLPRAGMEVHITGGVLTSQSANEGGATWVAYGSANLPLTFTWQRKHPETPAAVNVPARYRGSITELVGLGEDATSVYTEAGADLVEGELDRMRIALPPAVTVNQVLGGSVSDWEVKDAVLEVRFLEPVGKSTRFLVAGETRLPREGAASIPLLHVLDAEREEGGIAVEVMGAGEIKDAKTSGLEATEASALGQLVASRESLSLAAFRFLPHGAAAGRTLALSVVRYRQQAVLTANVEEARYRVLLARDGKMLVQARYAVRSSQRPFVKIGLPQGAILWGASVAGKPVRPGTAPDRGVLVPLPKTAGGDEAPTTIVEALYLTRGSALTDKGRSDLPLPSLDLPVSKTGVLLYYPPGFRMTAEPGAFRVQEYEPPTAADTGAVRADGKAAPQTPQQDILQQFNSDAAQAFNQALVDKFRARSTGAGAKAGPVRVGFPALGPSLYLAAELTGENAAPVIQMGYQRERKGGAK